ncbi:MAG: PH domain-containing protein [Lysobacter sp.]
MTQALPEPLWTEQTIEPYLDWQPLPDRARLLFLLGRAPWLALSGGVAGAALANLGAALLNVDRQAQWSVVATAVTLGVLVGAVLGFWLGFKQYRHTYWRLDAEGMALRRGRMWMRETRVPITRVQHLDLKRGPLQRRRSLATLIVHTAGTRHSAVTVPNIDLADAEYLRDRLGRQLDLDDDD